MLKSQPNILNSTQSEGSKYSYVQFLFVITSGIPYRPLHLTYKHIQDQESHVLLCILTSSHALY